MHGASLSWVCTDFESCHRLAARRLRLSHHTPILDLVALLSPRFFCPYVVSQS